MTRPAVTLATLFVLGVAFHATPGLASRVQAQLVKPPLSSEAGAPGQIGDPNEYLREQLILYIRPRLPEEQAFIDYVVLQVKLKILPASIANSAMLYARVKRPYPFPYFKMAVLELAKREEIILVKLPPSTTTPQSLPR
ncbi:MAG TPA: hypothetical protein VGN57_00175 [Pirellulaceae bacterium]|jgi:hypothetical protein|nr:hypothetical protein [Pirellulaceae bacterium]